ncbi:hypothetical protein [Actinomadura sp. WMMB 499]|uniref:hypothetical protein n=1 Tax=Actinomadura sp. WMMB 499 TaxID=1219491 RepID=UPI0012485B1A|nr:hypothetical protein [Actinomadura sp. WMMB 499]QFG25421.1 hypothetical protein F7P10_33955 [Actinomadura sp. WMMB 499]
MSKLTFDQVEQKVRELAAENPEFVYETGGHTVCQYNPDEEQPGCIFGQALIALERPVPGTLEAEPIAKVLDELGVETTEGQKCWVSAVQSRQDTFSPWGEAVNYADAYFAE